MPRSATPIEEPTGMDSRSNSHRGREPAEPYHESRPDSPSSSRLSRARSMGPPRGRNRSDTVGSRKDPIQRPSTANGRRQPSLADISRGPKALGAGQPPLPLGPAGNVAAHGPVEPRPAGLLAPKDRSAGTGSLADSVLGQPRLSPNRTQTFPLHNEDRMSGNGSNSFISRRPSEPAAVLPARGQVADPVTTSLRSLKAPWPTPRAHSSPDQGGHNEARAGASDLVAATRNERQSLPRNPSIHIRNASRTDVRVDNSASDQPPLPARSDSKLSGSMNESHASTESGSSRASGIGEAQTRSSRFSPPKASGALAGRQLNMPYQDEASPAPLPELALPTQPPLPFIPPESPTDPLCQQGRLSPIPRSMNRSPFSISSSSSASSHTSSRHQLSHDLSPRPPKAGGSRGQCRGCSQPIVAGQKSMSSKDGRLTGRYHKKCFACHTCQRPFETADFYVHDDRPFCAEHYHALNGSLCSSCGLGIEGQYLEATNTGDKAAEKFHPQCLQCSTCHMSLQDDYFEWMSRVYCERDARRAAAEGPARSPSGLAFAPRTSSSSPGSNNVPINASPLGQSGLPSGPRAGLRAPGAGSGPGARNGLLSPFASTGGGARGAGGRFPERRTTKLMMI